MWTCSKCGAEKEHRDIPMVDIKDTDLPNISSAMFTRQVLCAICNTYSLKASRVTMEEVAPNDTYAKGYVTAEWQCNACGHIFTSRYSTAEFDAHFDTLLNGMICENIMCKSPYGAIDFRRLIGASVMENEGVFS